MAPKAENQTQHDTEVTPQSAPSAANDEGSHPKRQSKGKNNGGKNKSLGSNTRQSTPNSSGKSNSPTIGFAEGNNVLQSYGLSISGRKERILSPFKADKYFHFVENAWTALVDTKPSITNRFSYAEFRHCSALQLYQRLEQVKFDSLGIKPTASTRIPLPRNLRVFQPLWSVLANIGRVTDDDLRVTYVPDGILPISDHLDDPKDVENLVECTLYDWYSSWNRVKQERESRDSLAERYGYKEHTESNESSQTYIQRISSLRRRIADANTKIESRQSVVIEGYLYDIKWNEKGEQLDEKELVKGKKCDSPDTLRSKLSNEIKAARTAKERMITPRLSTDYNIEAYRVSDGTISTDPGAYGARLHWDPQLWLSYEQFVEEVSSVAMFSQSMPVETEGTYAWLLPVESRNQAEVFCRLPKASIPPVTWIMSLLLQSSTLTLLQRANFYSETDVLSNVQGLRMRYIRSAIKRGAPIEQYGTI